MNTLGLKYIGSFQSSRTRYRSENPLEEVWTRIAQLGSAEFIRSIFKPDNPDNWDKIVSYSVVRIRQAVEFREAARQSTLLTSPLALYYSFLHLMRAFLALGPEIIPHKGHGLKFNLGSNLLSSSALISGGTFKDYLSSNDVNIQSDVSITLEEVLSRAIEIAPDYNVLVRNNLGSLVMRIHVDADMDGQTLLHFPSGFESFRTAWRTEFPSLAPCCQLEAEGNVLRVTEDLPPHSYAAVCDFCSRHLDSDLQFNDEPYWFLVRQTDPRLVFPRPTYYFVGMFILGCVVRYEPELMLEVTQPDSKLSWFLKRFVKLAERNYPQLMFRWLHNLEIYF
jgi:hypothetical protein